ncbi:hypothetical protein QBC41DRAFT_304500 [Cercophora samala]|uniref:Uncharacterized protein n=1 Tax=Cercophora samala TaxID=330535 RepID=A0AA39ZAG0_9PEZI|nr:hypothetical protein QBC41DRAFT_304500 [Cercophora samala]
MSKSTKLLAFFAGDQKTFQREKAKREHQKAQEKEERKMEKAMREQALQYETGRIVEKKATTPVGREKLYLYPGGPKLQAHKNLEAREREKSKSGRHHGSHSRSGKHSSKHPPDRPHTGRRHRTGHPAESVGTSSSTHPSEVGEGEDEDGDDGDHGGEGYPSGPPFPPPGPPPGFPPPAGFPAGCPPQPYPQHQQHPSFDNPFTFPPSSQAYPPIGPPPTGMGMPPGPPFPGQWQ